MLDEIIKFVGGSALLLACVAWLLRSLTKYLLEKDVAQFQETLRVELQRREFVFSRYHDKLIEILAELYRKMVAAGRVVEEYISSMGTAYSDGLPEAASTVASFKEYYQEHRIWFDKDTRDLVDALLAEHSLFYLFAHAKQLQDAGLGKEWVPEKLRSLWERAREDLPLVEAKLEARFRQLVGHHEESQA